MVKLFKQRGAMFGLDARIAMAIIAALSLVGGMAMFTTSREVKARALVKDLEAYTNALNAMEYDLKARITLATLPAGDNQKSIRALNDLSLIEAAYQDRWLGPYLNSRSNDVALHENYGTIGLFIATALHPMCNYEFCKMVGINEVPYEDFLVVNEIIDGPNEAVPEDEGKVGWRDLPPNWPSTLIYIFGKSL